MAVFLQLTLAEVEIFIISRVQTREIQERERDGMSPPENLYLRWRSFQVGKSLFRSVAFNLSFRFLFFLPTYVVGIQSSGIFLPANTLALFTLFKPFV